MTMKRKVLAIGLLLAFVAGCATKLPAPVADRRPEPPPVMTLVEVPAAEKPAEAVVKVHVVQKGETLIAVALQYGLDYRELAAWNNIENINVIRVGQELRVTAPGAAVASSAPESSGTVATPLVITPAPVASESQGLVNSATMKVEPRAVKVPYSDKALAQLEAEARTSLAAAVPSGAAVAAAPPVLATPSRADDEGIDWVWPAKGKVIAAYTEVSKGMDISGSLGLPVLAAASGKVVYSGTGLRGYGKLVIIKHNNTYLSAYAHNNSILVKEGQEVKKGQKIAEMGSTDSEQVKLHFEIRKQGKPVDPSRYLPSA
jgi:lipoprotein NlpD